MPEGSFHAPAALHKFKLLLTGAVPALFRKYNFRQSQPVAALPQALDQIERKGGLRKAVIFTESVRTQSYLAALLEQNGYVGEIVLLNGSNSDLISREIYHDWLDQHPGLEVLRPSLEDVYLELTRTPE